MEQQAMTKQKPKENDDHFGPWEEENGFRYRELDTEKINQELVKQWQDEREIQGLCRTIGCKEQPIEYGWCKECAEERKPMEENKFKEKQ